MAKKLYEEEKIKAIAEKIREKAESDQRFTTADMPGGVAEVYDTGYAYGNQDGFRDGLIEGAEAGRQEGYADGFKEGQVSGEEIGFINGYAEGETEGYNNGFSDGKKSEYDTFWDGAQYNGGLKNYNYAFSGAIWNDNTFRPKYDIRVGSSGNTATDMFNFCQITDLSKLLQEQGVIIDLSAYKGSNSISMFRNCEILTRIPAVNVPPTANYGYYAYYCPKLHTIDGFILSEEGTQTFSSEIFRGSTALKNITIIGKIGNSFPIGWSKVLSKDSIISVVNALLDTATGKTVTFSLTAVNSAFETSEGAKDGKDSAEWAALIATKTNWNVALA